MACPEEGQRGKGRNFPAGKEGSQAPFSSQSRVVRVKFRGHGSTKPEGICVL